MGDYPAPTWNVDIHGWTPPHYVPRAVTEVEAGRCPCGCGLPLSAVPPALTGGILPITEAAIEPPAKAVPAERQGERCGKSSADVASTNQDGELLCGPCSAPPPVRHTCEKCGESWEQNPHAYGPNLSPGGGYLCRVCFDELELLIEKTRNDWLGARKAH